MKKLGRERKKDFGGRYLEIRNWKFEIMGNFKFIKLNDLRIYQLARELSSRAWVIYEQLDWRIKKTMGDQFIDSIDSIGANIAEGYFRFHYLDKIKFYYNARGSHAEAIMHWLSLLKERNFVNEKEYNKW